MRYPVALFFVLFFFVVTLPNGKVVASDYFFRPVNIAHLQTWTRDLEFQVVNPGEEPVLLTVSVKQTGIQRAAYSKRSSSLNALPAQILLGPGTHRRIKLQHSALVDLPETMTFEILVKQEPVLFKTPGANTLPKTITVTYYTAEVSVRNQTKQKRLYALNENSIRVPRD